MLGLAHAGEPVRRQRRTRTGGGAIRLLCVIVALVIGLAIAMPAFAQGVTPGAPAPAVGDAVDRALGQLGGGASGQSAPLSLSLQVLIIMGLLTILPGILLMMTSFTRIVIVLAMLRQALGLAEGQSLEDMPYVLSGKLAGGPFGVLRFADEGTLSLPGSGRSTR